MNKLLPIFSIFLFIAVIFFYTSNCQAYDDSDSMIGINLGKLSFKQTQGSGFGYKRGYTSLELFIAPTNLCNNIAPTNLCNNIVPFIDLRGHRFINSRWASNAGIGVRGFLPSVGAVVGANIYYDYRDTFCKCFQQVGIGLEYLHNCFDARLNVYIPTQRNGPLLYHRSLHICDTEFLGFSQNSLLNPGRTIQCSKKYNVTMYGVDAELGKNFNLAGCINLYLAGGPYYYSVFCSHSLWGGFLRCSARFTECFSLEVRATSDRLYHTQVNAQLVFSIPIGMRCKEQNEGFCCWNPQSLNNRLTQRVYRNEIIPIKKQTKRRTFHYDIPEFICGDITNAF